MKFSLAFTGLLATGAIAGKLTYSSMNCIDPKDGFHVISAGGEYTTTANLSLLLTLAQSVLDIAPASEMFQIGYTEGALAPEDISEGLGAFQSHFNDYVSKCPKSKIVTLGYSVGATILMDSYCGDPRSDQAYQAAFAPEMRENLLANVVYGDLTFVSGERSARGTCTSGSGVVPRTFPGQCYPFGRKTVSYCNTGDPQCCGAGEGNPEIHFQYPSQYDADATQFVQAKWNYWKHNM